MLSATDVLSALSHISHSAVVVAVSLPLTVPIVPAGTAARPCRRCVLSNVPSYCDETKKDSVFVHEAERECELSSLSINDPLLLENKESRSCCCLFYNSSSRHA